tara:strand:- start:350 stop:463 length:114 start_codon:yes stop_codon:yes gene_type:complete
VQKHVVLEDPDGFLPTQLLKKELRGSEIGPGIKVERL